MTDECKMQQHRLETLSHQLHPDLPLRRVNENYSAFVRTNVREPRQLKSAKKNCVITIRFQVQSKNKLVS